MTLIQWVGAGALAIAAFGVTLYFQGRGKSQSDGAGGGDSWSGHHGGGHAGDPGGGDSGGGSD